MLSVTETIKSSLRLLCRLILASSIIAACKAMNDCFRPEDKLKIAGQIFGGLVELCVMLTLANLISSYFFQASRVIARELPGTFIPVLIYIAALLVYLTVLASIFNLIVTAIHEVVDTTMRIAKEIKGEEIFSNDVYSTYFSLRNSAQNPENRPFTTYNFDGSDQSPPVPSFEPFDGSHIGENTASRAGIYAEAALWNATVPKSAWFFTSWANDFLQGAVLGGLNYMSTFAGPSMEYLTKFGTFGAYTGSKAISFAAKIQSHFGWKEGYFQQMDDAQKRVQAGAFFQLVHTLMLPFVTIPDLQYRTRVDQALQQAKPFAFTPKNGLYSGRVQMLRNHGFIIHADTFKLLIRHMGAVGTSSLPVVDQIRNFQTLDNIKLLPLIVQPTLFRQFLRTAVFNVYRTTPELIPLQGSASPEVSALLKLTSPWLAYMDEETRFTCGLYYVSKDKKEETDAAIKTEFLNLVEKLYGSGGLLTYEFARLNDMSRLGFNTSVLQAEIAANATGAIPMSVLQSMVYTPMQTPAPLSKMNLTFRDLRGEYVRLLNSIDGRFSDPNCLSQYTDANFCAPRGSGTTLDYLLPSWQTFEAKVTGGLRFLELAK